MKKIITVLVFAIGFTLTTQAQHGKRNHANKENEKLTVAQKTTLAVKKMALKLDLTASQQREITPLLADKIAKRKENHQKRKAIKKSGEKRNELSANEIFDKKNDHLNTQIAFKAKMKRILNKEQYERFEKMNHRKKHNGRKNKKHLNQQKKG
ncbi:hypothetical protein [Tenacibaculum piscium]|uniref:hypothetical protein n=1 Tax=Tenacibaculum piscium TaxID=1458515 RepID=UPI001F25B67F|nr:hypothetical protein [Tenacibaculum piscium]